MNTEYILKALIDELGYDIEEGVTVAGEYIATESGARFTTQELRSKYPGKHISGIESWDSQSITISEPVKSIRLIKRQPQN